LEKKKRREGKKRGPLVRKGFGNNEREHWENKSKLEKAPGGRKGEVRDKKVGEGKCGRKKETQMRKTDGVDGERTSGFLSRIWDWNALGEHECEISNSFLPLLPGAGSPTHTGPR